MATSSPAVRWRSFELPLALVVPIGLAVFGNALIVRGIENLASVGLVAVGFAGCLFVAPIAIIREAERRHRSDPTITVAAATIAAVVGIAAWFLVALTIFVNVHLAMGGSL